MNHKITQKIVKQTIKPPQPDSHKGENGNILIIGGSPLFHGAGRLAAKAALETTLAFATKTNDMVYFASTKENISYLKKNHDSFIGITRKQIPQYLKNADVVLAGTGLMREADKNRPDTNKEPEFTKQITKKILNQKIKTVLDAGSIQVIKPEDLKNQKTIITPHRNEMAQLFNLDPDHLATSHQSTIEEIKTITTTVQNCAAKYNTTILLKGPIDIVASQTNWFYSPGGNAGMTKGGTGDILGGVTAALFTRIADPVKAAAAASFIIKRTSENVWDKKLWLYNATDIAEAINKTIVAILRS